MKKAKWIWCRQNDPHAYNQTVLFKRTIDCRNPADAILRIVADSWYRVLINGKWLHDGPARAYPGKLQYDEHDISSLLKKGKNRIEVIVRYFGCGTFHHLPEQAGLRAELHLDGTVIGTDSCWMAAPSPAWQQWVPKISIQMEPVEQYDARRAGTFDGQPAAEMTRPGRIVPRNTALLTKRVRRPREVRAAVIVKKAVAHRVVPVTRIAHPDLIEANFHTSRPVVLGSVLRVRKKTSFDFSSPDWKVSVDGRLLKTGRVTLAAGRHTVLFFCSSFSGHNKELAFPWLTLRGAAWGNWHVVVAEEFLFAENDLRWMSFANDASRTLETRWNEWVGQNASRWKRTDQPLELPATRRDLTEEQIFLDDFAADFAARAPLRSAKNLLSTKTVEPSRRGDVELCFDFGEQTCGYFQISLVANDGVVVDLNAVEHITPDGVIQHTMPFNRNGLRYITKKGVNRYTSLKRRSGRYLFMTLRNQKTPVEIKAVRIIESTAPVHPIGSFRCSDPLLDDIWALSERTLQLCMEDTFTDCPLYEQTLWIGDARNEALYAFPTYGNTDVSARSLELGAQSLDHFPIVGCQVPSSWDCLLPAWSFLWGMHVWEHYFYCGDKRFLKKLWPAVVDNLEGAARMMDRNGLFSGPFWNLLEWAPIDHDNETVLHNSMLLAAALQAGERCAEVLKETTHAKRWATRRRKLVRAINALWNETTASYPDAILDATGGPSSKTCQHTSMLALMCDIATPAIRDNALTNLLHPPKGMTCIGSPFAMQFMYEALEKTDRPDAILNSIREKFEPMIEAGATTVWEMFPGADFDTGEFPTRSHCHAWASSPLYFLNRIVLGIRPVEPGCRTVEISPWLGDLSHAEGASATPYGPVRVKWKRTGDALKVSVQAPPKVKTRFVKNASHPARVHLSVADKTRPA